MDRQKQNDFSLQLEQEVSNQRLPAGLSFANLNCFCPCLSMTPPVTVAEPVNGTVNSPVSKLSQSVNAESIF